MKSDPISSRLSATLLIAGGLFVALVIGVLIGSGDWATFLVPALAGIGIGAFLMMGNRYWLLIPFSLSFTFPIIPLGGRAVELPELTIAACAVLFLIRIAMKRDKFRFWRADHLPFILYAGWAMLIFLHNPIGLTLFGAASGGARFYFKILLALSAFIIIANQKISERDCKWIFVLLLVGSFLDLAKTLSFFYFIGGSDYFVDPLENYTWQQELSVPPLMVVLVLFSRYRASELFALSKIWRPMILIACGGIILLSGKRSAVIFLGLYPMIAAFFRKEFRYIFLWAACAAVAGTILVAGQGELFDLPLNAQRALSWLPGHWDARLASMEGGKDVFREKLRVIARDRIREHPWIGNGYEVNESASERLSMTMANKADAFIMQMALGASWHNRWLGYAADFGIPASILLVVIFLFVIWRCWWALPRLPSGSLLQAMVMYVLISTVTDVVFSNVAGHTAVDAFTRWWMYGTVVSIAYGIKRQRDASTEPTNVQGRPAPGRLIQAGVGAAID